MKPRKIMVTIEALSNIPIIDLNKMNVQQMFDEHFIDTGASNEETFIVHQVKAQVVRPEK